MIKKLITIRSDLDFALDTRIATDGHVLSPASCDHEPLYSLGTIQPRGILLVARRNDLIITHASENLSFYFGFSPAAALGRSLRQLLGDEAYAAVQSALVKDLYGPSIVSAVTVPAVSFSLQMIVHAKGDSLCIELEAMLAIPDGVRAIQRTQAMMHALHAANSQRELCDIVVTKLRELTGYDRAMVYRLDHKGGHGEVIAEDRERDLEPYLGMRYPVAGIPHQAIYLAQHVRAISDVDYVPVSILSDPALGSLPPFDTMFCALRSVSPVHLEYMRNMGIRASLDAPLIIGNALWGIIICHHRSPHVVAADLRRHCDLIGQLVSLLLATLGETDIYTEQFRRQSMLQEVNMQNEDLASLRHHDLLTGLPNGRTLQERIDAQSATTNVALLCLNLDQFRAINLTNGRAGGDCVLVEVAERLAEAVTDHDLVARVDGDEFVVLCPAINLTTAVELAERICQILDAPFYVLGRPFYFGVSVGVAHTDTIDIAKLQHAADIAMYEAKRQGGKRIVVFSASLRAEVVCELALAEDLREALMRQHQLSLEFQPVLRRADRHLLGFEALIRWDHPRHGRIASSDFVRIAEKTNTILTLGRWALSEVVSQARAWQDNNPGRDFYVSLDVSPVQLVETTFAEEIEQLLAEAGLAASCLCLEVTERAFVHASAASALIAAQRIGVQVRVSNFGAGYLPLSYLSRLPALGIKLDRSVLKEFGHQTDQDSFLDAVIRLVHNAKLWVPAGGVEKNEHLEILTRLGCSTVEGFLLTPPMDAIEVDQMLKSTGWQPVTAHSENWVAEHIDSAKRCDQRPAEGVIFGIVCGTALWLGLLGLLRMLWF